MIFNKETYEHWARSPRYPVFIGILAFALMGTGVVPFELVFMPAIAAAPKRWRSLTAAAAIGSSLGALVLAMFFRFLGWPLVDHLFPTLGSGASWARAVDWVSAYGAIVLIPLAAMPITQMPILVIAGLLQISGLQVLAAFLVGKAAKYSLVAWGTIQMENRIAPYMGQEVPSVGHIGPKPKAGPGGKQKL